MTMRAGIVGAVVCLSGLCGLAVADNSTGQGDLAPIAASEWNYARATHLLERAGFGGTPEEVEKLAAMTPDAAVNYLVDYESVDNSALPPFEESNIYPNGYKFADLQSVVLGAFLTGKAFGVEAVREGSLKYQPAVNEFYTLLISDFMEGGRASQWWAERMLATPRPFEEKFVLFWHDHFATSQEKVHRHRMMLQQIQTLRERQLGNYRDMLVAMSQDPAMLRWLDNKDNLKGRPNENYAREIMELFTMGEGQGYTQQDVREMARAFTGWTMAKDDKESDKGEFIEMAMFHDAGEKTILGETGNFDGYGAIDLILRQPSTARFISGKIYRYFVREDLSDELQEKLATLLRDSGYKFRPFMKTLFLSKDFYSDASVGAQVKEPVHLLVSTYRKLGLKSIPGIPDFNDTAGRLGQSLLFPPNVAGWAGGTAWINPATLLVRGNFAHDLLFPQAEGFIPPDKVVSEGYRKIPIVFAHYEEMVPQTWNTETQKMEPCTVEDYARYLAKLDGVEDEAKLASYMSGGEGMMGGMMGSAPASEGAKSKMGEVAQAEDYNLALGLYTGFTQAFNRIKPIPRTIADINFTAMLQGGSDQSPEAVVDYFCKRFLNVPLHADRKAAIVEHLRQATQSLGENAQREQALKETVHLILSTPEYQIG